MRGARGVIPYIYSIASIADKEKAVSLPLSFPLLGS